MPLAPDCRTSIAGGRLSCSRLHVARSSRRPSSRGDWSHCPDATRTSNRAARVLIVLSACLVNFARVDLLSSMSTPGGRQEVFCFRRRITFGATARRVKKGTTEQTRMSFKPRVNANTDCPRRVLVPQTLRLNKAVMQQTKKSYDNNGYALQVVHFRGKVHWSKPKDALRNGIAMSNLHL